MSFLETFCLSWRSSFTDFYLQYLSLPWILISHSCLDSQSSMILQFTWTTSTFGYLCHFCWGLDCKTLVLILCCHFPSFLLNGLFLDCCHFQWRKYVSTVEWCHLKKRRRFFFYFLFFCLFVLFPSLFNFINILMV